MLLFFLRRDFVHFRFLGLGDCHVRQTELLSQPLVVMSVLLLALCALAIFDVEGDFRSLAIDGYDSSQLMISIMYSSSVSEITRAISPFIAAWLSR